MSQIRARLVALRAKREQSLSGTQSTPTPPTVERPHAPPNSSRLQVEWRARARHAASERIRRAALDSGVYKVITRPLPKERDDIEELEKRKSEEAEADMDEDDQEIDEEGEEEEEKDEEEAALERLERGIFSNAPTRDADTRDPDTRHKIARDTDTRNADTRDGSASRSVDDSSTLLDAVAHPECTRAKNADTPSKDVDKSKNANEEGQPVQNFDKHWLASETGPSTSKPRPGPAISETGPETLTSPSETPQDVTPPPNPLGMVEDEAEDEEDQAKEVDDGNLDLSGDAANDVMPDADIPETDTAKLAEFHRKWEAEQMGLATPCYDDVDDAMDFTDIKGAGEDCVCAEGGDAGTDRADSYINAMFLQDDSKSKVVDVEEEDAGDETTREKARVLWKVRQKLRIQFRDRNESNSLSRFDLFSDSQDRSAGIRSHLEKSCRPAPLRDVTDVDKSKKRKLESSEWARRKEILEQKERKRRRAVSVGNWSFTMHGKQEGGGVKKTSARPSLGAAHLTKRCRTRKPATPPRSRPSHGAMPRRKRGATSFKDLLSVLGKQAIVDPRR